MFTLPRNTGLALGGTVLGLAAALVGSSPQEGRFLSAVDIQQTSHPAGDSPWTGQTVSLEGTVTAVSPHGLFYYVAHPGGGPWSGLKVLGGSLERTIGESVFVKGRVLEQGGETRLEEASVRGRGAGAGPSPSVVGVGDLLADPEPWEGVLCRIEHVTVLGETNRYGEFPVQDSTGAGLLVDDEFFTSYIADPGDTFDSITGVVSFGFGNFRIEPRSDDDLSGWVPSRVFDASVELTVRDEVGAPIPCRVTFFPADGSDLELGPDDRVEASFDVAYLERGDGTVRLPSGTYDVVVSRGIEYGIHEERVSVPPGGTVPVIAELPRETDSSGWISGDFHLHAAPSTDTPLPVPGRIVSLAGEGVEWAIATDHNMVTDYAPVIADLGIGEWITSSLGDEITTRSPSFGHFNAWPLDPGGVPPPWSGLTPGALFAGARSDPGTEVVQVNHPIIPSWGNQYFQIYEIDPFTGKPRAPGFSFDFDALEVFNGRYLEEGVRNLGIWMRMLNNGHRITATGNSDSHHLVYREPGYPRNYVASSTDSPAGASEDELVRSVLAGRVFVTYGPLLDLTAGGAGLGETVSIPGGPVELRGRVQCPSWMRATEARIYGNGKVIASFPLAADVPGPQDISLAWTDRPERDTWYVLVAEGDGDLMPVRRGVDFRPFAFTNPVWVDLDGDGGFDPPGNQADAVTIDKIDAVDANGVPLRLGDWVSVVGSATTDTRFLDPAAGIFYVEDGTGGVQVRERAGSVTEVRRGDRIVAGGFVSQALGETILTDADVEILETGGQCPAAAGIATGDLALGVEPREGTVARIEGANVTGGSWPVGGAEGALVVDDGSGPATLHVPAGVEVPPEAGGLADFGFTALVTQRDFSTPFLGGYRLTLRRGADLLAGSATGAERGSQGGSPTFGRPRPNPFRSELRIPVLAGRRGRVPRVEILDVTGRRIRALIPARPGAGEIVWDGRDGQGRTVAAGVYFLRLIGDRETRTIRTVKLK